MVVLSAALINGGKTLVARQFVEMTRQRVEGLFSVFPKLTEPGKDHTFVETENVRYVYQPMESLRLVVITNKASNILEDLETLRLFAKVVQDCCQQRVEEERVLKYAFDIVFAFDEVISFGHRESVALPQIKTYTEMESHEENQQNEIIQRKVNEAHEVGKTMQRELAKKRAEMKGGGGGKMGGFGGGGPATSTGSKSIGSAEEKDFGTSSMSGMAMAPVAPQAWASTEGQTATIKPKSVPRSGLALGKAKFPADLFGEMSDPSGGAEAGIPEPQAALATVNPLIESVRVDIVEQVAGRLSKDGRVNGTIECAGNLTITVLDAAKADLVCFTLTQRDPSFKYKTHPHLNKQSMIQNVLEVRDASRAFRANTPLPLLTWRVESRDDSFIPIALCCWPTPSAEGTTMVVELELIDKSMALEDIHICFPAPPNAGAVVASASPGQAQYDASRGVVNWFIDRIDGGCPEGSMEFTAKIDEASLYPASFEFIARGHTRCQMDIEGAYHQSSKAAIDYHCDKRTKYELTISE